MHALGKFFLVLVSLLSVVAFWLTAKSYEVRSAWQKEAARLEKQVSDNKNALDQSRLNLSKSVSEYDRLIHPWRNYWTGIKVEFQAGAEATGGLLIQLGLPQLTPADPAAAGSPQLLHAFQPVPGGTEVVYVGEFRVEQLGEGNSVLMPNWMLRPNELKQWVVGENWHFRETIPAGELAFIGAQQAQLSIGEERLRTRQAELAQTDQIIQRTNDVLKSRVGEIEGISNPDERKDKLPPEFVFGLLQTIQDEESEMNRVTGEVQQLRDELYNIQAEIDALNSSIRGEMERLEGSKNDVQASLTPAR